MRFGIGGLFFLTIVVAASSAMVRLFPVPDCYGIAAFILFIATMMIVLGIFDRYNRRSPP